MTQRSIRTILSTTLALSLIWLSEARLDAAEPKPEKNHLEVAIAAYGPSIYRCWSPMRPDTFLSAESM
jgi:hypothetical protein